MGLSRRKMFGVAAGGAIAGPGLARAAAQQIGPPTTQYHPYGNAGMEAQGGMPAEDPARRAKLIAKLKRLAAGDIGDEDSKDFISGGPSDPYQPLKSVSPSAQQFMRNRQQDRKWRERTIQHALACLNEYDKTGILRTFLLRPTA